MAQNIFVLITAVFILTNCNSKSNKLLEQSNTLDSLNTNFRYQPAKYFEKSTDTIIDSVNNLKLNIKRYSLNQGFEVAFEFGDTKEIIHFRDFACNINLLKGDSVLFSQRIQKEDFEYLIEDKDFLQRSYLSLVDFLAYNKDKKEATLKCMLVMIESDYAYIFELKYTKSGAQSITLIE
ncbi:MAG: DUF4738 domain-containing protein [Bacteroidia bacterium]